MQKIKLFCLPYAGGAVTVYYKWKEYLEDYIEFIPIELSGRGKRIKEPFYHSIEEGVEDIFSVIEDQIEDGPYLFYGHSMATLFLYELVHKIQSELLPPPVHMILSGRTPPQFHKNYEPTENMGDEEFLQKLKKFGGTSEEFFKNKELMDIFIPILRSDYQIVENYEYKEREELLETDITFLYSDNDVHITLDKAKEWGNTITGTLKVHQFNGGHFFIHDQTQSIVRIINEIGIDCLLDNGITTIGI